MLLRIVLRVVAALLAAFGVAVLVLAVARFRSGEPRENWQRLVARSCAGLVLLTGAPSVWRLPKRLPARRRRRVYELTHVLASPDLLRDFQESSPSVKVLDALLSDWRDALRDARRDDTWPTFSSNEQRDLCSLEQEIDRGSVSLPLDADRITEFSELPAWTAIRSQAGELLDRLRVSATVAR